MPRPSPAPVRKDRRALGQVGGEVALRVVPGASPSDADLEVLKGAVRVQGDEDQTRAHVHGFHSYPARLHPETAARLIEGLCEPGRVVLDPFCGSGTVLVEAHRLGRIALGVDANPLAVALSRLKTSTWSPEACAAFVEAAHRVAQHADLRRKAKAGPTRKYPQADRDLFAVHVLLELDGLADGLKAEADRALASALRLVLSSILHKVSHKVADTQVDQAAVRIASGFTIKLFRRKAEELARRMGAYQELVREPKLEVRVSEGDARVLHHVRSSSVRLAVTSPPYPGVYDYAAHHFDRLRWLEFATSSIEQKEIGARRSYRALDSDAALERWHEEFSPVLSQIGRVLEPDGRAVVVLCDTALGQRPLFVDRWLEAHAPASGLRVAAVASQARAHVHDPTRRIFGAELRREHAILLERGPGAVQAAPRSPAAASRSPAAASRSPGKPPGTPRRPQRARRP